jgi:transposase
MPDGIRWVGLDVHARESTLAVFDQGTGEVLTRRMVGRPHELLALLLEIPRPARMVYEAGPTGYGLARRARAVGIELGVCAPSKTERPPADRVKTDKRDVIRLARLLSAGELTLVTIPSVEREQLRDLVRCREDIRLDLMRARNRIGKFLLRREIYWDGPGETWSRKHRSWLTSVRFADLASRATLADYLHAHDVLIARRDQIEADLAELATCVPCAHTVARLRCLARDRHAHSAGALCRDRRMGALRSPRPALLLPRDRPLRAHHRQPAPARVDHQGRLHPRPAAAGRGRIPLPPRTCGR